MFRSMAWSTSAENNLDSVNSEENTKRFFNKKDAADTTCTLLQNVDRLFIHQTEVKLLYHAPASSWFDLSTPPFLGHKTAQPVQLERRA